ncbi:claudin-34-like [Peromyscus californicus insignis]|uniref:claudin-34-like n=1 Tax=Peromyscus californicus insignis TaxID=564181 RepID=UPI0022A67DDD|nr:claudin-34-like [Peromyscus californicus insignis]
MVRKHSSRQLGGFAAAILAWILCSASMALPHWRVWGFREPMDSKPRMTLVGMWMTCVYHQENLSNILRACYPYTYQDTFIPLDIRVAQHLLLVSSFLGMVATVSIIVALWKIYSGKTRKKAHYNPFFFSGVLNIIAGSFVFLSVLYNYFAIIHKDRIAFPPYFRTPSFPDTQRVGTALTMATLSSVLFLVGGTISLSFTFSRRPYIHSNI